MTGPLAGMKVVEAGTTLLGPACSLLLAEFGADVVKIESPAGDVTRHGTKGRHPGMSGEFLGFNFGKRSVALDLKQEDGQAALLRIVAGADVFLHNMRPRAAAALGITCERFHAVNPRLVYCGTYGYGEGLPYSGRPAYDDVIQGASGIAAVQGMPTGSPTYVATLVVDKTVAIVAAAAICAALAERERTGVGRAVEVPMYEVMARFALTENLGGWTFEPPVGPMGYPRIQSPHRRPYATKDGYVAALMYTDRHWHRFFEAIGRSDILARPQFRTREARITHIDALYAVVGELFVARTSDEWVELLGEADIPITAVATLEDLMHDEHLRRAGIVEMSEHPTEGVTRRLRQPRMFPGTGSPDLRDAPHLGEHSVQVLTECGLDPVQIDQLIDQGAVVDGR